MVMSRGVPTYIDITSRNDLEKFQVKVNFQNLEYIPSSKKSIANLNITLVYPKTTYRYGALQITGDATASASLSFPVKDQVNIGRISKEMLILAQQELDKLKSEITGILNSGAPRVTINLDDALERLHQNIRPKGS